MCRAVVAAAVDQGNLAITNTAQVAMALRQTAQLAAAAAVEAAAAAINNWDRAVAVRTRALAPVAAEAVAQGVTITQAL